MSTAVRRSSFATGPLACGRSARAPGHRAAGFTLVELMVVAVVLAILAAAIMSSLVSRAETARRARAQADIATFETLLELYYLDVGHYPATEEGLRVLYYPPSSDEEKWKGPYVKKPLFADPWARDYVYRSPGQNSSQPYEILSYGKDGQEGGEGDAADVTSWVEEQGS